MNNNDRQQMNGNGQTSSPLRGVGRTPSGGLFRHFSMPTGGGFSPGSADYCHLVFLLEGTMEVSCNEFSGEALSSGEFILVPVAADTAFTVLSPSEALVFTFGKPVLRNAAFSQMLVAKGRNGNGHGGYTFVPLALREPFSRFLTTLLVFMDEGMDMDMLAPLKTVELFILLEASYAPRELATLFQPLAGGDPLFRLEVMRAYRKAANLEDFARLMGMEKRAFSRVFIEEFDTSPYQWLMEQRAKHIRFALRETDRPLKEVREMYGFRYAGHFTRFCREQFGETPLKFRRSFQILKNKN